MKEEHFSTTNINIDLHIHSNASYYKDGNIVKESNIYNTNVLINALEKNNINMFSITDHNRFDYNLYAKLKDEIKQNNIIKKILPGIEFDVILENNYPKCHVVTIFDDSDEEKLKLLSKTIKDFKELSKEEAYTTDDFETLLKKININAILIVHQKQALDNKTGKTDSLSAACEDPSYFLKTGFFDSLEYSTTRTEGILKNSLSEIGIDYPIITGSDCHEWAAYPYRDNNSKQSERTFSSLRCLPSFKGLLMSISSFNSRANRYSNDNKHYIKSITIGDNTYPLSNGINAIIGDNGSGKSLLLNLICSGNNKVYDSIVKNNNMSFDYNDDSFQKESINYITQGEIVKKVRDGNLFDKDSDYYDNITTKDLFAENIKKYFADINKYIKNKITINEEAQKLRLNTVKIVPVKRNFYLPIINSSIELEDITFFKERSETLKIKIDSLKNEFEMNEEFYKNLSLTEEINNTITQLERIYDVVEKKYKEKEKYNKSKGIVSKVLNDYSLELNNRRTSDESKNEQLLKTYNDFAKSIVNFVKINKKDNAFPKFPKILSGFSKKQINDYEFVKTTGYNNIDLKDEFYKWCFNTKYSEEKIIKKISNKDEYLESLKGCTSLKEIDKFITTKIQGFIDEWSKESTFISAISSKSSIGNTPGEISLVYYKFLIQEKESDFCVLAIDQPEDDINPKRINDFLIKYLSGIRDKKQILIVTHNPLLVVNLDVDNVIYLNKVNNNISMYYGALEYEKENEYSILDLIKNNLDGGYKAIEGRIKKYDRDSD